MELVIIRLDSDMEFRLWLEYYCFSRLLLVCIQRVRLLLWLFTLLSINDTAKCVQFKLPYRCL